ncbi:MAG: phosphoribosylanthranilate isomerase [Phycisphaerales bacterium]|jgi:phosphoribosylanthranilate isomerase
MSSTHRTRIKVCGIRDHEAARVAAQAGADTIGFIFVEGSPRYIEPREAVGIMMSLPPLVSAVGVTQDLSVDEFCDLEEACPTPISQLHGAEDEKTVRACGPGVIKAFKYEEVTIASRLKKWGAIEEVDAVLIDGGDGGEGTALDWDALSAHLEGFAKPVFLAGGLTPENVGEAIARVRPYAVDVSSGVESSPGVKDHDKIRAFVRAVLAADAAG